MRRTTKETRDQSYFFLWNTLSKKNTEEKMSYFLQLNEAVFCDEISFDSIEASSQFSFCQGILPDKNSLFR